MWQKPIAYLKEDPAVFAGFFQALIAMATQLGLSLTAREQGSLLAAVTAGLALLVAAYARPFKVSTLTGFGVALGTVLLAFGVPHVTPGLISSANAAVGLLAGILVSLRTIPVVNLPAKPAPAVVPPPPAQEPQKM